jgi:hypothetical protein
MKWLILVPLAVVVAVLWRQAGRTEAADHTAPDNVVTSFSATPRPGGSESGRAGAPSASPAAQSTGGQA